MLKIKLKSGGHIIEAGRSFPYKLISVSGLDGCDFDIGLSSSALYDGGYITKSRMQPREIDISFDMTNDEGLRRQMIKLFSPHSEVELTVTRFDTQRSIRGIISECGIKQSTLFHLQTVSLTLLCPDPYFCDCSSSGISFSEDTGLLHLVCPLPQNGFTVGKRVERDRITVNNSGDASCGFDLSISFRDPVQSVTVTNTSTDEFVRLDHDFSTGDLLRLSTRPGNEEKCLQYLDRRSVFFPLRQGETGVRISGGNGGIFFSASLSFEQLYLGV